jgi:hypothetical protein
MGFFKDHTGQLSMTRLLSFMLVLSTCVLIWYSKLDASQISAILIPALALKGGQKHIELNNKKDIK